MTKENEIKKKIEQLVKDYFYLKTSEFIPGKTKIPLNMPSYSWEEAYEAIESIITTWVTMGDKVAKVRENVRRLCWRGKCSDGKFRINCKSLGFINTNKP